MGGGGEKTFRPVSFAGSLIRRGSENQSLDTHSMSTESPSSRSQYLLLFRGADWPQTLSPEQIQSVMSRWREWFAELDREGRVRGAQPLVPEGRLVSGKGGHIVADGPFAESKEAIGGYFAIVADDMDEAVEIAQGCPGLEFGAVVEVRPVAPECPIMEQARRRALDAAKLEPALV